MTQRDQATEPQPSLDDLIETYAHGAKLRDGRSESHQELLDEGRAIVMAAFRTALGSTSIEHGVKVIDGDGTVHHHAIGSRQEALAQAIALQGTLVQRDVTTWRESDPTEEAH